MKCNVCYEIMPSHKISKCLNCKESGYICHSCIISWANENNDILVCSICKQPDMINVPLIAHNVIISDEASTSWLEIASRNFIHDTCCKSMFRYILWLLIFAISSTLITLTIQLMSYQTNSTTHILYGCSISIIILRYNQKSIYLLIMPSCLRYDLDV